MPQFPATHNKSPLLLGCCCSYDILWIFEGVWNNTKSACSTGNKPKLYSNFQNTISEIRSAAGKAPKNIMKRPTLMAKQLRGN